MKPRDAIAIAIILLVGGALETFRLVWFEPRAIALACLHHTSAICAARSAIGWLTHYQIMGGGALLTGIAAIAGAPFTVAITAICLGVAGLIDYNISWGMLGAALGAWAWLQESPARDPMTL